MGASWRGTRRRRNPLDLHGRERQRTGFDVASTAAISRAVSVPVIVFRRRKDSPAFSEIFTEGCADAALAASIFLISAIHPRIEVLPEGKRRGGAPAMLIPCIDLQGGQAVQLVHGRKRDSPSPMSSACSTVSAITPGSTSSISMPPCAKAKTTASRKQLCHESPPQIQNQAARWRRNSHRTPRRSSDWPRRRANHRWQRRLPP